MITLTHPRGWGFIKMYEYVGVFKCCLDALQYSRFLWNTTVIWRIVQELHISTKTSKPGKADFWKK